MPYRPRVLMVIADSSRTGGPEHVLTLARELAAVGWQPGIVCPEGELHLRCGELGLETFELGFGGSRIPSASIRLRHLARRYQADVLHSHGLRAGAVVRRARVRVPWIHTHHLDGWFTVNRVRVALHRYELRALASQSSLQIAVSQSVADFLKSEVGVAGTSLRVVPNGIDLLQARVRPGPRGHVVGVLARLVPSKGVDLAVMALAAPAGRALTLRVGGKGPELSRLVDLAERLAVADRVNFVGEIIDRQGFFDGCDVVWVPSRAEPFGLVACEAMSAGVPVVASRVGGLPEIIDAPRAGVLVAPANPTALASVTAALLGDYERYRGISVAGAERVVQRFTATRMGALTRGVYREVLK